MKITIDIDCTPEEARRFLGLPDFAAVNEALQQRMAENLKSMDPESLAKNWWSLFTKPG